LAELQHQTCLLKELSPAQAWPHFHATARGALWQLQGVLKSSKIILSSPLLEAITIFTDASGHGTAAYYTKDCHRLNILFSPQLKG
jgi:hypothetical protein